MLVCIGFLIFILRSYDSSEKYGSDKSMVPDGVANFIYGPKTGNSNLRRHLYNEHGEEYDKVILQHKWGYKLSTESHSASTQNACNQGDRNVPSFSLVAFLEHLVHFVVADDQVSPDNLIFFHTLTSLQLIHVEECPEFQKLCMVLCEMLIDTDIPCCDKMREAVINRWQDSFGQLKLDLSVGIWVYAYMHFVSPLY